MATISESRRRFLTAAGSSLFLAACAAPQTASLSRDGFLDVPGGKLYYETAGEGTPLIFLHGFAVDHRAWDAQFKALATSYRVVRFDLRGFGRSTVPSGPYSHSDDLLHLMRHLAIGQSYLAGASMGGRIAIDFALEHSQKVLALATINPVISGWEWSAEWLASYAPIVQAAKRGELSAAKAAFLAHPIFATIRAQPEAYAQLRRMVDEYSGWHFQHADPARNLVPPALTRLERLKVPTLLVSGAQDLPDFQRMTRHLEREAQARRVGLPGVGHMAHLEAPRPVSEALQAFFRAS
ncbi:MAG TPA: alpha/beta fold hydrolase [Burkholderiales bacterium]|nr:alpha/beta fold hydrolase [Burkholderiales bacterium]